MTPFLEVKDVRKSYGAIRAVDGVSFTVAPGEIVGELTTQEEIDNFKHGNVIVRAIGLKDYVRPETALHERIAGDIYVLCSDGLSDMVDDWSIENVLEANADDLEEAAQILIRMANDRGGKDNITAVLVRVDDDPVPYADGSAVVVFIDMKSQKSKRIPEQIRARLERAEAAA